MVSFPRPRFEEKPSGTEFPHGPEARIARHARPRTLLPIHPRESVALWAETGRRTVSPSVTVRRVLKSLVVLMVAGSVSLAEATSALAQVPVQELSNLLGEDSDQDWTDAEKRELARLLASDNRPAVRFTLAAALSRAAAGSEDELELIAALSRGTEEPVRRAASVALAAHLRQKPALQRLQVLTDWALSDEVCLREVAARTMAEQLAVPAADAVLEQLMADSASKVREQACEAMLVRFGTDSQLTNKLSTTLASSQR